MPSKSQLRLRTPSLWPVLWCNSPAESARRILATLSGERSMPECSEENRSTTVHLSRRPLQGSASSTNSDWRSIRLNGKMRESTAVFS